MNKLILVSLLFLSSSCLSQKAKEYYHLISEAEDYILEKKLDRALIFYDSAFIKYDYPFIRDVYQACFIASYNKDFKRLNYYTEKCLLGGCGANYFDYFIKKHPNNSKLKEIILNEKDYFDQYKKALDFSIIEPYLSIQIQQQKVHERNLKNGIKKNSLEEKKLSSYYCKLIDSLGFPKEKKTGLGFLNYSNSEDAELIFNRSINFQLGRIGNMFLQHYSPITADTLLYQQLIKGVENLEVSNVFLGQLLDISKQSELDNCIGFGSEIYSSNLHYKKAKRYYLEQNIIEKIDERRSKLYLRGIKKEKELIRTLIYYETGKYPTKIKEKCFKKYRSVLTYFVLSEKS